MWWLSGGVILIVAVATLAWTYGARIDRLHRRIASVIWLITLLANQSIQIHNLHNPADPQVELTEEEFELLTVPADLGAYREAIAEALYRGTRREVISQTPKP